MIINHVAPIEDTEIVAWSPSSGITLYDKIGEEVPDDTGFIYTTNELNHSTFRISPLQRAIDGDISIKFRAKSTEGDGLTVILLDGETIIAERLYVGVNAEYTTMYMNLTPEEVGAITDFNNIHIKFIGEYTISALLQEDGVSRFELENGTGVILLERST